MPESRARDAKVWRVAEGPLDGGRTSAIFEDRWTVGGQHGHARGCMFQRRLCLSQPPSGQLLDPMGGHVTGNAFIQVRVYANEAPET